MRCAGPSDLVRGRLLESLDTSNLIGLRDRTLIGVITYAFARIGAVVTRVEDYYPAGKCWWVQLQEKGGQRHEMPAQHKVEQFIDEYLDAAGIREGRQAFLFRWCGPPAAPGRRSVTSTVPGALSCLRPVS